MENSILYLPLKKLIKKGRYIEVVGNLVTLELFDVSELSKILKEYALEKLNIPIVQFYVKER